MIRRIMIKCILAMGVLALLTTTAEAFWWNGIWITKGAEFLGQARAVSPKDIADQSVFASCAISNISSAVVDCNNKPGNGPAESSVHDGIFEFGEGFEVGTDNNCDRSKGLCFFDLILNSEFVGQRNKALCRPGLVVVDVTPVNFEFFCNEGRCTDSAGADIACDSDGDGVSDDGVFEDIVDTTEGSCTLPSPETLGAFESRQYDCEFTQ